MHRRTTTLPAALLALLILVVSAPAAIADPGDGQGDGQGGGHSQARRFFWMNALRSTAGARAHRTATSRMHLNVEHLRAAQVDFGVFAETEPDQRADFRRFAGSTYRLVTGHNRLDNVVFYRRSAFRLVDTLSMTTRYTHGERIHTAIPVLRDRVSGGVVAVIPVHNPKLSTSARWRALDLAKELARVQRLQRQHPSWQVVVAGDFNGEWTPACTFTRAGLVSPLVTAGRCRHVGKVIDQMFATPGLRPHGYRAVHTTATDHHREYHVTVRV
jgi:hypothetical protein